MQLIILIQGTYATDSEVRACCKAAPNGRN